MRRALAFAIVLLIVCDLAVIGVHVLDATTNLVTGRADGPLESSRIVPSRGQAFVSGEVEGLSADNAQVQPLSTPLEITNVERGVGRLVIEKAMVNGRRSTISWDGGTPLPLSGAGGLDLGTTHVEVDGNGVAWSLDGGGRTFLPGTYRAGAPVAVGTDGLAAPRDGVEFTADEQTVLVARGKVVVHEDRRRVELLGPGKLQITGRLRVQFSDRTVSAGNVRFGEGAFRVTVDPDGDRQRVNAVLQGPVDVS